jgi:hypothetical protein
MLIIAFEVIHSQVERIWNYVVKYSLKTHDTFEVQSYQVCQELQHLGVARRSVQQIILHRVTFYWAGFLILAL